jgi:glucose-6-phosphate isomerase
MSIHDGGAGDGPGRANVDAMLKFWDWVGGRYSAVSHDTGPILGRAEKQRSAQLLQVLHRATTIVLVDLIDFATPRTHPPVPLAETALKQRSTTP